MNKQKQEAPGTVVRQMDETEFNMKKVFMIIFILIFSINVSADEINELLARNTLEKYSLLTVEGFERTDTVTRYECLNAIMKAIGAADDMDVMLYDSYSGKPSENAYHDGDGETVEANSERWIKITNDGKGTMIDVLKYNLKGLSYIRLAFYNGIAKGEIYQNRRYFCFDRAVTAKEATAFMVRCLEGLGLENIDETYLIAKERGLVKEGDVYFKDGNNPITPDDFCIILQRFLYQKRYIYFNDVSVRTFYKEDEERSMTYIEYLQQLETDL